MKDVLARGFSLEDVPRLRALNETTGLLDAFIGVFRGTRQDVVLRLHILAVVAERGEAPAWTPEELRQTFSYLNRAKFDTALSRLGAYGLLFFNPTALRYQIGADAFVVLSAWATAAQFADTRLGEFGFLNVQLAGTVETGGVSEELLSYILARTNGLQSEIETAVQSGSQTAVLGAKDKLEAVFEFARKGVELLGRLAPDSAISARRQHAARRLAHAQSRMLGMLPRLDHVLHQIESQKVLVGEGGVDTSHVLAWLQLADDATLRSLASWTAVPVPPLPLLLGDIAADVAADVLSTEVVRDVRMPPARDAPDIELDQEFDSAAELDDLLATLEAVQTHTPLTSLVAHRPFPEASYRLSLLTMLGDAPADPDDPAARLAQLPLQCVIEPTIAPVESGDIERLSVGGVEPTNG